MVNAHKLQNQQNHFKKLFSCQMDLISDKSPLYKIKPAYSSIPTEEEGAQKVMSTSAFALISGNNLFLEYKEYMDKIGACKGIKILTVEGEKRWGSAFVKQGSEFADHFNYA